MTIRRPRADIHLYDRRATSPTKRSAAGCGRFFAGLAFTAAAVSFLALIANRAGALAREVGSRRSAEERLKVLIHELNHRVRNVMSVAQAVVRLSFTAGSSLADVQKTCEGRLQALANAMSLLTASDWKSVNFRSLITDEILPFSERINTSGPDIALKARSAQTFALAAARACDQCGEARRAFRSGGESDAGMDDRRIREGAALSPDLAGARRARGGRAGASRLWRIAGPAHCAAGRLGPRQGELCRERLRIRDRGAVARIDRSATRTRRRSA